MRTRLHSARKVDRRDTKNIYAEDHQSYGRSAYDPLVVKLRQEEGFFYVYIEKIQLAMEVEEIAPGDKSVPIQHNPVPLADLDPRFEPIRRRA